MKQFFYSIEQQQFGPVAKEELQGKITKETLVWCEGMENWTNAGDVEELADMFPNIPTPPPIPEQKKTTPPPFSSVEKKEDSKAKDFPQKKSKKKWILISLFALIIIGAGIVFYVLEQKSRQLLSEGDCPSCYLSILSQEVSMETLKKGTITLSIRNKSKYTSYGNIDINITYVDKNGNTIQSDVYTMDGTIYPKSFNDFSFEFKLPNIFKTISTDDVDIEIKGAIPYQY